MADEKVAKKGDTVKVHYTGKLTSGERFDSSEGKEPLSFTLGKGQVIAGFESAVEGMKVGESKQIKIAPDQAYGDSQKELVREVPKSALGDVKAEVGMVLGVKLQTGQEVPVRVTAVGDESVTLDLNHPLAGQTLTFDIKLVDVGAAQ